MEITNDNYFNIKYNTTLDRLEVRKKNRLLEKIKNHKIISAMVMLLMVFSCLNFFLIFSFVKVIGNV